MPNPTQNEPKDSRQDRTANRLSKESDCKVHERKSPVLCATYELAERDAMKAIIFRPVIAELSKLKYVGRNFTREAKYVYRKMSPETLICLGVSMPGPVALRGGCRLYSNGLSKSTFQ